MDALDQTIFKKPTDCSEYITDLKICTPLRQPKMCVNCTLVTGDKQKEAVPYLTETIVLHVHAKIEMHVIHLLLAILV